MTTEAVHDSVKRRSKKKIRKRKDTDRKTKFRNRHEEKRKSTKPHQTFSSFAKFSFLPFPLRFLTTLRPFSATRLKDCIDEDTRMSLFEIGVPNEEIGPDGEFDSERLVKTLRSRPVRDLFGVCASMSMSTYSLGFTVLVRTIFGVSAVFLFDCL